MINWQPVKLKDIAFINPTESLKVGIKAKYIGMENLSPFTRKVEKFELKDFRGGTKFRNGDILLARITPCLENGKTARVDILDYNEVAFGSTEYIVIRGKPDLSDSKFLYYLAISPRFRELAIKAMTGTSGRQRVQTDQLVNEMLTLPNYETQRKIGEILSSLDDKIELLKQQNKTLENIAQTLFKRWFVEFNFPNGNGKPYKDSGGEMVESEIGIIPAKWTITKLHSVIEIRNGYAFKSMDYRLEGIPIIRTTNFKNNSIVLDDVVYLDYKDAQQYYNFRLNTFDFLLVMVGASIGKSVVTPSNILPALQNQNMWNFIPKVSSSRFYNLELLKAIVNNKINSASGSAREFFRKDYFYNIDIIKPSDTILLQYNEIVENLYMKIDLNFSQIKVLIKIRDTILPKLMNGEINIKY